MVRIFNHNHEIYVTDNTRNMYTFVSITLLKKKIVPNMPCTRTAGTHVYATVVYIDSLTCTTRKHALPEKISTPGKYRDITIHTHLNLTVIFQKKKI